MKYNDFLDFQKGVKFSNLAKPIDPRETNSPGSIFQNEEFHTISPGSVTPPLRISSFFHHGKIDMR